MEEKDKTFKTISDEIEKKDRLIRCLRGATNESDINNGLDEVDEKETLSRIHEKKLESLYSQLKYMIEKAILPRDSIVSTSVGIAIQLEVIGDINEAIDEEISSLKDVMDICLAINESDIFNSKINKELKGKNLTSLILSILAHRISVYKKIIELQQAEMNDKASIEIEIERLQHMKKYYKKGWDDRIKQTIDEDINLQQKKIDEIDAHTLQRLLLFFPPGYNQHIVSQTRQKDFFLNLLLRDIFDILKEGINLSDRSTYRIISALIIHLGLGEMDDGAVKKRLSKKRKPITIGDLTDEQFDALGDVYGPQYNEPYDMDDNPSFSLETKNAMRNIAYGLYKKLKSFDVQ